MSNRIKNIFLPIIMAALLAGVFLYSIIAPQKDYSDSERRVLKKAPKPSFSVIQNGSFMKEFEEFSLDQFPFRDGLRTVKALSERYAFLKKANNGLYLANGYLGKLEYPLNMPMLEHAADRFNYIYETYLKPLDIKPYMTIVPDKNYFLAEKNGYLSLDYNRLTDEFLELVPYMEYIPIMDKLTIDDYYRTDTHWRQERLPNIARIICSAMGAKSEALYRTNVLEHPFYGVYYDQAALPIEPDEIKYLTNDLLDSCIVTNYDKGKPVSDTMYNMKKAFGKDPYEMFLSGSVSLLTIDNPNSTTQKELVMFRDSFGSSLAPLLASGYSKITLVDIRYIQSRLLGSFVDFENADVLFEYSTLLLNNSLALK